MLAFAKKAAEEMQKRLKDPGLLDDGGKEKEIASTFHKLGSDIIVKVEREGEHLSLSPLSEDDAKLRKQVEQWFEKEMRDNPSCKQFVLDYFIDYLYPAVNPFDFKTKGEYFEYILTNEIRTLKGEKAKSLDECLIANQLFELGVEYQYRSYKYRTREPNFRQYFYLLEYDIYVEHFGIDRDGNTVPYVDEEKYLQDMEWKRE